ncbi:MAG: fused MFS/spermidine synthase [Saprospiraceae bacterium]
MQFPWYKKLASYFTDILIESCSSEVNPELDVVLSKGRLKLSTPHAVYSESEYYYNFSEVFKKLNLHKKHFPNTLVLGLGLGSIPIMLERIFHVKTLYTILEIDPTIIQLFKKYVQKELRSEIQLIHEDAFEFINKNKIQYNLICVDLFIDNEVPQIFEQLDFLEKLKKSLCPGGILIYNRIDISNRDHNLNQLFDQKFLPLFPARKIYPVGCNLMFTVH